MPAPGHVPRPSREGPKVWGSEFEWNVENAEGNKAVHIWRVLLPFLRSAGLRQQQRERCSAFVWLSVLLLSAFLGEVWAWYDLSEELLVRVLQKARSSWQIVLLITLETNYLTSEHLNFSVLRSWAHWCYFLNDLKWELNFKKFLLVLQLY